MLSDAFSDQKFLSLKKKLDSLHYCHPLGLDSAPLVEKLLNDLISTMQGFQTLKKSKEEMEIKLKNREKMEEGGQKTFERLIRENNELHQELMKIKEESEMKEGRWRNMMKGLEGEKGDLKFVIKQKEGNMQKIIEEV